MASASPEGPPAIDAVGLGRDFGATRALDALDLVVPAGAVVGLLGPNGAGKTTAMLLLATLLRPSRGEARVFGHDITHGRTAIRRDLGLVFQEASVDGLLTVEENLLFAARLSGFGNRAARRAASDAMERVGLAEHRSQPVRQLSTGWRRLVDLARATLHRPALLILDEPTVGLDPEHRERAWRLLETERHERGTTVLFSTHYLAEAEGCDRVILLARGRVVASDTPTALKATMGDEVVEVEGPDARQLLSVIRDLVDVRRAIMTERGCRLGIVGSREGLTRLASVSPKLVRLTVRPATLDDVYFAMTQPSGSERPASDRVGRPA
jgi:ABC-type multidrug transport system ATPase subunit